MLLAKLEKAMEWGYEVYGVKLGLVGKVA